MLAGNFPGRLRSGPSSRACERARRRRCGWDTERPRRGRPPLARSPGSSLICSGLEPASSTNAPPCPALPVVDRRSPELDGRDPSAGATPRSGAGHRGPADSIVRPAASLTCRLRRHGPALAPGWAPSPRDFPGRHTRRGSPTGSSGSDADRRLLDPEMSVEIGSRGSGRLLRDARVRARRPGRMRARPGLQLPRAPAALLRVDRTGNVSPFGAAEHAPRRVSPHGPYVEAAQSGMARLRALYRDLTRNNCVRNRRRSPGGRLPPFIRDVTPSRRDRSRGWRWFTRELLEVA